MKVGMAVLGGYVLGRTKKGGLALRLAMMAAGVNPRDAVRENLTKALKSPDAAKIANELTAPLVEALRAAAMSAVENRVGGVADSLAQRTANLRAVPGAGGQAGDKEQEKGQQPESGSEESGKKESGNQGRESDAPDAGADGGQSRQEDENASGEKGSQSGSAGQDSGDGPGDDERGSPEERTPDSDRAAPQRSADASR